MFIMDWVNWALDADAGDDWFGLGKFALEHMAKRKRSSNSVTASTKRRRTTRGYRPRRRYRYKKTGARASRSRFVKTSNMKYVNRRLQDITRSLKSDQASHTIRRRDVQAVGSSVGQCNVTGLEAVNTGRLENAMANLRYYNPAVPGTLTTADASTGTYTRQVHFAKIIQRVTVRNNYQVPCWVTVYACTPKQDTNTTMPSFYSEGATDQTIGPIATTSPLLFPTDIKMVHDNWTVRRKKHTFLQPGQQFSVSHYIKAFDYDPSNVDTHSLQFQKKYGGFQFCIRVEGPLEHDTSLAEYTVGQCMVDTVLDWKMVITYDAGVNLNDFSAVDNTSSAFTNGGVVSNKPISDNQSYSVN